MKKKYVVVVTTPYCSGLSLLPTAHCSLRRKQSPVTTPYCSGLSLLLHWVHPPRRAQMSNHPLLFGTVSPTEYSKPKSLSTRHVTTPYCSGLSLLHGG